MEIAATKSLSELQTAQFDLEYVTDELWQSLRPALAPYLGQSSRFLDIGGGNGMFVDRVTNAFAQSTGVNVEPAANLVASNRLHSRKSLVNATFQDAEFPADEKFDVIFFNWVLHHFVVDGYAATIACQKAALRKACSLLKPNGAVFVLENLYEGRTVDNLPSRLIYGLTSSNLLKSVTSRMGANTAGTGVCFHSKDAWYRILGDAGYRVRCFHSCYSYGELSPLRQWALHLRDTCVGLMVASPQQVSSGRNATTPYNSLTTGDLRNG